MLLHNDLVQGSDDWLTFRKGFDKTSSTAPAAKGIGYDNCRDATQLARQCLGFETNEFSPFVQKIMQQGHDLEPVVRKMVEEKLNTSFQPNVATNGDYLRSSDGFDLDLTVDLEIKVPQKATSKRMKAAVANDIIEMDKVQMDHALLVTEFDKCVYAVYAADTKDLVIQEYYRDDKRIKELVEAWNRFDELLANPSDLITEAVIPDDLINKIEPLLQAKDMMDEGKKVYDALRKELFAELPPNKTWVTENKLFAVSPVSPSKPGIDYKALVEANKDKLSGVDFEMFRKSPGKITQRINDNRR